MNCRGKTGPPPNGQFEKYGNHLGRDTYVPLTHCLSPAAGGVSLLALAPQVVGERELEQRREDEGRAGAHPKVQSL